MTKRFKDKLFLLGTGLLIGVFINGSIILAVVGHASEKWAIIFGASVVYLIIAIYEIVLISKYIYPVSRVLFIGMLNILIPLIMVFGVFIFNIIEFPQERDDQLFFSFIMIFLAFGVCELYQVIIKRCLDKKWILRANKRFGDIP